MNSSKLINALGGGIWSVVLGDYDRDDVSGDEVEMVVDTLEVHPNFTDYQNDIGNEGTVTDTEYIRPASNSSTYPLSH